MTKKYITELIYNLLEKGYSKEVILFYITSTVDVNIDIDTIERLYKLSKMKWLKAKYNNYDKFKETSINCNFTSCDKYDKFLARGGESGCGNSIRE